MTRFEENKSLHGECNDDHIWGFFINPIVDIIQIPYKRDNFVFTHETLFPCGLRSEVCATIKCERISPVLYTLISDFKCPHK